METQEAIKSLAAAGKGDEVKEYLEAEAKRANANFARIRGESMYTDEAKRWQLAVAYVQQRRRVDQELADKASRVIRTDRDDAERVFGVKGLAGDAASLVISRRDAADRVAAVKERSELRELLRRATRSGDEVLARAVAERAVEMQDATTMNQFLADRPELDAAGERLWNAQRAEHDTMGYSIHLLGLKPHELSGMDRAAIEHLANNQPAGASR